jgi:hypothetical protein
MRGALVEYAQDLAVEAVYRRAVALELLLAVVVVHRLPGSSPISAPAARRRLSPCCRFIPARR